jgi:hypothetical protein
MIPKEWGRAFPSAVPGETKEEDVQGIEKFK